MPTPIHAILAAVDLSADSTEILHAAGSLSAATGAELHVVHAFEPARGLAGEDLPGALTQVPDARDSLWAAIRRASPAREPVDARVIVWTGRPVPIILEAAKEISADLIVLGRHQPRSIADRVRSTTAEQLLRQGAVPCLILQGSLALPPRRIVVPHEGSPHETEKIGR